MNGRAIGCGLLVVAGFIGLGVWGLSQAMQGSTGCREQLVWSGIEYRAEGAPSAELRLPSGTEPALIGVATVGVTTRTLYGPPGSAPAPSQPDDSPTAQEPPDELALDCADGTFRAYRRVPGP